MTPAEFFASIFAFISLYGLWRWRRIRSMRSWTRVPARIVKLEVEVIHARMKGTPYTRYVPKVEYNYVVNGTPYTSNRFSIHNFTTGFSENEVPDLLHGAKVGDSVDAYCDPRKPARVSLTVPGYDGVVLALFIGFGGLILVLILSFAS